METNQRHIFKSTSADSQTYKGRRTNRQRRRKPTREHPNLQRKIHKPIRGDTQTYTGRHTILKKERHTNLQEETKLERERQIYKGRHTNIKRETHNPTTGDAQTYMGKQQTCKGRHTNLQRETKKKKKATRRDAQSHEARRRNQQW